MVTYVALLMLLQLELAPWAATLCAALLFLPWAMKPLTQSWVRRVGHFRRMLHLIEALLFASLMLLAFSFNWGAAAVFLALLMVSLFCAWHELTARMYYERFLRPSIQRLLAVPRQVCSQMAVIFTYGALIFLVGSLQVYFRQIRYSWSLGCYVAAGLFLLFACLHLGTLPRLETPSHGTNIAGREASPGASPRRRAWAEAFPLIFLLLLPQSLMFFARVLYLYDTRARGGLQCTMQEIGFAQGTVGVIAFSLGIAVGGWLIRRYGLLRCFWPLAFCLALSPFVYWGMTLCPPVSLWTLCCCTMAAQLFFGLGLGVCRLPLAIVCGSSYPSTAGMLQIPLISAAMIVPMAVSGWLTNRLGYDGFFLLNALSAPACLLVIYLMRSHRKHAPGN